jgi:hypothetical protein
MLLETAGLYLLLEPAAPKQHHQELVVISFL